MAKPTWRRTKTCSSIRRFRTSHDSKAVNIEKHYSPDPSAPTSLKHGYRPDAEIISSTRSLHIDVSVIHPLSQNVVSQAATSYLHAAKERERSKTRKCEASARFFGHAFYPFIVESYGA